MIVIWLIIAVIAVTSAVMVITLDNPVHSALCLVMTLLSVAGMYALLNAPFLAIIQVTVYAGAIMVLFLFVIMLLNLRREEGGTRASTLSIAAAALFAFLVVAALANAAVTVPDRVPALVNAYQFGGPHDIGEALFNVYVLPFEVTSLLLTVAMVGAIVLARRKF